MDPLSCPVAFYRSSPFHKLSAVTVNLCHNGEIQYCEGIKGWYWLMLSFTPSSILSFQVFSLKAVSKTTMALPWFSRLVIILLACAPRPYLGCPSGCRCYSLTVECGSLGLKEIPQGVPSVTEVSWPINIKWGHKLAGHCSWPATYISGFVLVHFPSDLFLLPWNDCG